MKDQLGLTRHAPDEFKVVRNAPLEMPTQYSQLPTPRLGAPRPQERQVTQQVKEALLGEHNTAPPSEAEALLLQQSAAEQTEGDIRNIIDREHNSDDTNNQSVAKRLLGIGGNLKEDHSVLDATAEAERLKETKE